jgi:hypothetical protein
MNIPPAVKKQMAKQRADAFVQGARNPAMWRSSAGTNRRTAKVLYDHYIKAHRDYVKWMESSVKPPYRRVKVPNETIGDMGLGKSALMHYGLALECNLKAHIVEDGVDPVQNALTDNPSLKSDFLHHDLTRYVRRAFASRPPAISPKQSRYLIDLTRAIAAGKYPVEKSAKDEWAYTAELDEKVDFAENFIRYLKAI